MIFRNVSLAANHYIRIISEGSCNIKDMSNDAENSALHHRNTLHFKMYYNRKQLFKMVIIFNNATGFTLFMLFNCAH